MKLNQRLAEGNLMRPCSDSRSPTQTASNLFCVTSSVYLLHRKVHFRFAEHTRNHYVHMKDERARTFVQCKNTSNSSNSIERAAIVQCKLFLRFI